MRYIKYTVFGLLLLIAGMYGWYLMATAINKHVDYAAFGIIEDTLVSNAAYDLSSLREVEHLLILNDIDAAKKLISEQIDLKIQMLDLCVSDACIELQNARKELQNIRAGK